MSIHHRKLVRLFGFFWQITLSCILILVIPFISINHKVNSELGYYALMMGMIPSIVIFYLYKLPSGIENSLASKVVSFLVNPLEMKNGRSPSFWAELAAAFGIFISVGAIVFFSSVEYLINNFKFY